MFSLTLVIRRLFGWVQARPSWFDSFLPRRVFAFQHVFAKWRRRPPHRGQPSLWGCVLAGTSELTPAAEILEHRWMLNTASAVIDINPGPQGTDPCEPTGGIDISSTDNMPCSENGTDFRTALQPGGTSATPESQIGNLGQADLPLAGTPLVDSSRWIALYGGHGAEEMEGVWPTSDGGFVVAGSTSSYGVSVGDAWLLKVDGRGAIQWQKTYGGANDESAIDVRQTSDGGYIVAGWTKSFGAGQADFWVFKLNAAGALQWQKTYGGAGTEQAWSVQPTADGGYIVAGGTTSFGAGAADSWVLKLDANGNIQWQKTYGGPGDDGGGGQFDEYVVRAIQDQDGNYVVATETASFGHGATDIWVFKLDANGSILWQKAYGGTDEDTMWSFQETSNGSYIVPGATISFSPDNSGDLWALQLDKNGNIQWQNVYGLAGYWNEALSVGATSDGGSLIGGYYEQGTQDWDLYLLRLDANGVAQWQKAFEYAWDWPNAIQQLADGGYIVAGVAWPNDQNLAEDLVLMRLSADGTVGSPSNYLSDLNLTQASTNSTPVTTNATVRTTTVTPQNSSAVVQDSNAVPTYLSQTAANQRPTIGSLSDSPDPVTLSTTVTLTANSVADADGTVQQVEFYRDSNANGTLDVGTDALLGTDTSSTGGWTWTGSVSGFAYGLNRYFARAQDNDGAWSDSVSTTGVVKADAVGTYGAGVWDLDQNRNDQKDANENDVWAYGGWGQTPIVGDWNKDGTDGPGVYADGTWRLDVNGNSQPDDLTFRFAVTGVSGLVPVSGDWNGDGQDEIGLYASGWWLRDINGDQTLDNTDWSALVYYGASGLVPVVGDWDGDRTDDLGVYAPSGPYAGKWATDTNHDGRLDASEVVDFGLGGYSPVVGDWNGDGSDGIGVFAASGPYAGYWARDLNENGQFDDPVARFGNAGDVPVVGNWPDVSALRSAPSKSAARSSTRPLTGAEWPPIVETTVSLSVKSRVPERLADRLEQVSVAVTDLPGSYLALTSAAGIVIDRDATDFGWLIDRTPLRDGEFGGHSADGGLIGRGVAGSHVDLLTVVAHERGHAVRLPHDSGRHVMHERLPVRIRRLLQPDLIDAAFSTGWNEFLLQ